ncbi:Peptide methionine sulfoxide reductase A2 [Cardamine amara subsp. amara]|uniref:peptide-methionine (S)-S-oxide reductase n=1 Tax=Cardamine amara subsp. amara TaxID=228776 RepID=A0ABD0ZZG0_CARAN
MDSSLKAQEPQIVETLAIASSPTAQEPDNDVPAPGKQFAEFAAGCFWGMELAFQRVLGVTETEVGYAQGMSHNPSYEDVCTNTTNHVEVVRVQHDPTTLNRQGELVGAQYR